MVNLQEEDQKMRETLEMEKKSKNPIQDTKSNDTSGIFIHYCYNTIIYISKSEII